MCADFLWSRKKTIIGIVVITVRVLYKKLKAVFDHTSKHLEVS